jgi:hypothetical protein
LDGARGARGRELNESAVANDEVGIEPPAQAAVEALGPLDVGDGENDCLDFEIDRVGRGDDFSFRERCELGHSGLLQVGCVILGWILIWPMH